MLWHTFLGGIGSDLGEGIAVDGSGNAYVMGFGTATWQGASAPVTAHAGLDDVFVAKLAASGALLWNTFLGCSINDYGLDIAVDSSSCSYVTGYSYATWGSPLRPFTSGADAFAAKLNSGGAVAWSMFLGGSAEDIGFGIATNGSDTFVTGRSFATWGSPLVAFTEEVDEGMETSDAFVAKIPEPHPKYDLLGTWDGQGVFFRDSNTEAWAQLSSPADYDHLWRFIRRRHRRPHRHLVRAGRRLG